MVNRVVALTVTVAAVAALGTVPAGEVTSPREALQALNPYIGAWKGSGTSERNRTEIWNETGSWRWRFKGKDAWLVLVLKNDKRFKGGELRYLADKDRYQFTATPQQGAAQVFEGQLKKSKLFLTRVDPGSKETQQLQWHTAAGDDRLILNYAVKPANRTLFTPEYQVALTREGVSFAAASKKPECIVTGGLGTTTVTYQGMTFYVCCSGCRDAFNENPEKFIKEYRARKKAGN